MAFFVVRAARRSGLGRALALETIAHHPGPWEIAFQDENPPAARFWRGLADAAFPGGWREERRPVPGKPDLPPDVWIIGAEALAGLLLTPRQVLASPAWTSP